MIADTIPRLVRSAAGRFGDREAIKDGDVSMSFAELGNAVLTAARAAIAAGLKPGDRFAVWAPNTWEWIVAALGSITAGGILVPVNTRFKGREAASILQRSGVRLLFTVDGFLGNDYVGMLREAGLGPLDRIVLLRGEEKPGTVSWSDHLAGADEVLIDDAKAIAEKAAPDDLSDIIFTSGTTGLPKGVMTTHAQTLRVFETWSDAVGLRDTDRYLIVNPFFHTFGYKAGFLAAIMRGATIVPHAVFAAAAVMSRIAEERITVLPGPPTLYQSILDSPDRDRFDLSSLRLAVTGAAVVPVRLIERMREELTFETILTAYGLTESTGTATMCRPGDDAETIATTSGCAIPDTEVRVVDERGEELAAGQPGEVVVRGYNVMKGYYEDPVATAKAIDKDGWLHTGDVGLMDQRGYLRITDRLKDMYISGGFNVYPAEVEGELLRHPAVGQAAVVGAPDERLGEVGVAFVVPLPGQSVDEAELIAWARERMANFKAPRRVEVTDALPVNASGKVLKYELRERAKGAP